MALSSSITSYYAGKYSDKLGRKIFLIIQGLILSGVIVGFTFITSLIQLYILQILFGVTQALFSTMETSFLGDITEKISRGTNIGKYHAIVGVMGAFAIMISGYIVGEHGIKIIFYIAALIIFFSTLILFYLKE